MKTYYVYILSCSDGTFYTGVTNDLATRVYQHNHGLDPRAYTKHRRPVKLSWSQEFFDPLEAIAAEKRIKKWSQAKKRALIKSDWQTLRILSRKSSSYVDQAD